MSESFTTNHDQIMDKEKKKVKLERDLEPTELGQYSSRYHSISAQYRCNAFAQATLKNNLFQNVSNSFKKDEGRVKNITSFRSPSPCHTNTGKFSFSGGKVRKSAISKARDFPYPIYSPLPPTKLPLRSSNTPKSNNGRSPCWSEAPTVIIQSITPKRT